MGIGKNDIKKHSNNENHSQGDASQLLPPIGKPQVSLMIEATSSKKVHKAQPKPAPTLQQKTKHNQMVPAARRKKDEQRMGGPGVYAKTSMTETSRSGAN